MKAFSTQPSDRILLFVSSNVLVSHFLFLAKGPASNESSVLSSIFTSPISLLVGIFYSLGQSVYIFFFTSYADFCSRPQIPGANDPNPRNIHPVFVDPDERAKHNSWLFISLEALMTLELDLLWLSIKAFQTFGSLWRFEQDGRLTTAFHSTMLLLIVAGIWTVCAATAAVFVIFPTDHMCTIAKQAGFYPLKLVDRPTNDQEKPGHSEVSLLDPD